MTALLRRLACLFGRCQRCETYSTVDGIGGRCIDCGRVHGRMSRDALADLAPPEAKP